MTTIPTRDQLHEEVDRVFRDSHPDAPERLDPDDPDQADLVKSWLDYRDEVVNRWTDDVYHEAYPDGPTPLDPNDPNHAPYVERWLDIRDQIRDDAPAKFDHDAGAGSTSPVSLLNVEADPSDLGAILLNFDGPIDPAAIGPWLWPDGAPDVTIEAAGPNTIRLRGLTNRAWMDMDPGVQEMIKQAGLVPMEA